MVPVTTSTVLSTVIFVALFFSAPPLEAASFDCMKAGTRVEKLICADKELSGLDDQLALAYKKAIETAPDQAAIKWVQVEWLNKNRNTCEEAVCLKRSYEARIEQLTSASHGITPPEGGNNNAQGFGKYRFSLLKGAGTPVCDAYLKRLDTADYKTPAYCDRPEETKVPDFTVLNRVSLTAEETFVLYPRVSRFMTMGEQGSKELDVRLNPKSWGPEKGMLKEIAGHLRIDEAKVWRYDPPIDIDNDGKPDNIVVWQGMGADRWLGRCGEYTAPRLEYPKRSIQVAYFTESGNDRIDEKRTRAIFGHPSRGYQLSDGSIANDFRPVGLSIGIFKYRDLYYFDTYFDHWGDIENKRANTTDIHDILAVFLHQSGKTRQVCEYRMTETAMGR